MSRKPLDRPELWERERVGATIRQYREMRGWKPDPFANEVGISRPYLLNIEAGRKPLTEQLLLRFAQALKVQPIAILHPDVFKPQDEVA